MDTSDALGTYFGQHNGNIFLRSIGTVFCLFLLIFSEEISGQSNYPDIHEYVHVDQEAVPLNFELIRQKIGYPPKAMKKRVEGMVYVRVLISDKGAYLRHRITRSDHPWLEMAVDGWVSELEFSPAYRNDSTVFHWVNIPFTFHLAAHGKRNIGQLDVFERWGVGFARLVNAKKRILDRAREALQNEQYDLAEVHLERFQRLYPLTGRALRRTDLKREFLNLSIKTAIELENWNQAEGRITEMLGLLRAESNTEHIPVDLYMLRGQCRLAQQEILAGLRDFQWVMKHYAPTQSQPAMSYAGLAYARLGAFEESLNILSEAGRMAPNDSRSRLYMAEILGMIGSELAGEKKLREVIELGPPQDELSRYRRILSRYNVLSSRE